MNKYCKKYQRPKKTHGFTIVELMIATVIFSLVMVICLTGMVQVSRAYYKGITHSRTQEAARNLMDEITQTIQLSGSSISRQASIFTDSGQEGINNLEDGIGVFCAGNKMYTYVIDRQVRPVNNENLKQIRNAIISEDQTCAEELEPAVLTDTVTGGRRSLLSENMRLTKLVIQPVEVDEGITVKSGSQLWEVQLSLAYGDQDLISYTDDQGNNRVICRPGTGNEFCSIVELSTIVGRRIGQ